jgi:hypothetical protein
MYYPIHAAGNDHSPATPLFLTFDETLLPYGRSIRRPALYVKEILNLKFPFIRPDKLFSGESEKLYNMAAMIIRRI